jgi:hypothetical protein
VALPLPLFEEPQLSNGARAIYPDTILAPLAIDAARRWMLTADIEPNRAAATTSAIGKGG